MGRLFRLKYRLKLGWKRYLAYLVVGLLLVPVAAGLALEDPSSTSYAIEPSAFLDGPAELDEDKLEREIHQRVNEERRDRGLEPLEWDDDLSNIATIHSRDMAEKGYFAHTSPSGISLDDRYRQFGYHCEVMIDGRMRAGAENIAKSQVHERVETVDGTQYFTSDESTVAEYIVHQWMLSTLHRQGMMMDWNGHGIGVSVGEKDGSKIVYVTQNFC